MKAVKKSSPRAHKRSGPLLSKAEADLDKQYDEAEAWGHLRIYVRTRNGWFIWRAFRVFRLAGLPIPEALMVKLDQIAGRLLEAGDHRAIAKALEMTKGVGGPQGRTAAIATINTRAIAQQVNDRIQAGQKKTLAYERVGKPLRKTEKQVKEIYLRWQRKR